MFYVTTTECTCEWLSSYSSREFWLRCWKDWSSGICSKLHAANFMHHAWPFSSFSQKFPATCVKIPVWSLRVPRKIYASLEALLRGKHEIFTQDTWKLDLFWRWYCTHTCMSKVMRKPVFCHKRTTRHRSAYASVKSDQGLCHSLPRYYNTCTSFFYIRIFKPLASLDSWAGWF